jgi:hypothetical protein
MPWLADVATGALAPGVNGATLLVFNLATLGAAASLAALLTTPAGSSPTVAPHVWAALGLTGCLLVGVNWVVSASGGLTTPAAQRAALGLDRDETESVSQKKAS